MPHEVHWVSVFIVGCHGRFVVEWPGVQKVVQRRYTMDDAAGSNICLCDKALFVRHAISVFRQLVTHSSDYQNRNRKVNKIVFNFIYLRDFRAFRAVPRGFRANQRTTFDILYGLIGSSVEILRVRLGTAAPGDGPTRF